MTKRDLRVFIIEDDPTLGKAMTEAVKAANFSVQWFTKPDEALTAARYNPPHALVIDCMLPKINGVNLALQLRENGAADTPILFTSGIYRDKHFIKETLQKTKAIGFLIKPFDISVLTNELEVLLSPLIEAEVKHEPFFEVLTIANPRKDERLQILKSFTSVHGFEVPRVVSLIGTGNLSGVLSLLSPDTDPIKIHFSEGSITKVEMKVTKSFFGALLLERNLIDADELTRVLNMKSEKPIGERLVDENLLSPHMIGVIGTAQTCLRLSGIVTDKTYEVSFATSEPKGEPIVDAHQLFPLYSDWVKTKLNTEWLKTFYLPWFDNLIFRSQDFAASHPALKLEPVCKFPQLIQRLGKDATLAKIMTELNLNEEDLFACIHYLVLARLIVFDRSQKVQDLGIMMQRLEKIAKDLSGKNHFDVLGVTKNSRPADIKRAYHELAKTFHPDKLPAGASTEMRDTANLIFNKMTAAYDILKDDAAKTNYLKELERGQAEQILQSESLIEDGKALLKQTQIQRAFEKFRDAEKLRPPTTELHMYLMWCRILLISAHADAAAEAADIQKRLNKIPPEDRHSPLYYFVKGIYLKYLNDFEIAKNNFKQALFLDPSFVEAQRELKFVEIARSANRPKDMLSGDLTTVINSLFSSKKRK